MEEVNLILDRERAAQFGVEGVPAIVLLRDGADTRMRFLGAPAGYEFMSLVEAVTLAGTDGSGLQDSSKALLGSLSAPLDIKVFVTPDLRVLPAGGHDWLTEWRSKVLLLQRLASKRRSSPSCRAATSVTGVPKIRGQRRTKSSGPCQKKTSSQDCSGSSAEPPAFAFDL